LTFAALAGEPDLMTTDEHFEAALKGDDAPVGAATTRAAQRAAQNPAQHVRAASSSESQTATTAQKQTPVLPRFAAGCGFPQQAGMARAELPSNSRVPRL
jgi:hypothetical protein